MGKTYGYLGLHGCSAVENNKPNMYLSGYPSDKGGEQWQSKGSFGTVEGNIMRYNIYSIGGFSGGPVFDSAYSVYVIHGFHYTNPNPTYNGGGVRMHDYLFNLIVQEYNLSIGRHP